MLPKRKTSIYQTEEKTTNIVDSEEIENHIDEQLEVLNDEINEFMNEYMNEPDPLLRYYNIDEESNEYLNPDDFNPDCYNDVFDRDEGDGYNNNTRQVSVEAPKIEKKSYIFEILDTNLDEYLNQIPPQASEFCENIPPAASGFLQTFSSMPNIHICSYYVNTKGKSPFLQYFLYKEKRENGSESFTFPTFKYDPRTNVIPKVISIMEALCISYYKGSQYVYKGFKIYKNDIYIFFDCSQLDIESVRLDKNNDLWLVLIDEIINKGHVCQYKITDTVIDFFFNNNELIFLRDSELNIYETPSIVYASCPEKRLHFCSVFGVSSIRDETSLFGNYYYFTDYQNIFKQADHTGVLRVALFLGRMKLVRNFPEDPVDTSEITQQLLDTYKEKYEIDKIKDIQMQLRISDRDGLWTAEYDSIFLGKIEMDDGRFIQDYPLWVVKDYEQQIVISSHVMDKKKRENNGEPGYCCIR